MTQFLFALIITVIVLAASAYSPLIPMPVVLPVRRGLYGYDKYIGCGEDYKDKDK
jgi:hypothetical protein